MRSRSESGSALLVVLSIVLIISIIGANVLLNCSTRYNAIYKQVKAWKESLYAAEAGGDIGYAEARKWSLDRTNQFLTTNGWTCTPNCTAPPAVGNTYTSQVYTFGDNNMKTATVMDVFKVDTDGNPYYRIRSRGTAPTQGLKRVTMDDRVNATTKGDSLLRKIDFQYDHFVATYGPNGDGQNKALVTVSEPQLTRRIEQIALPMTPFEAALKAAGSFYGPGAAGKIDSYNSDVSSYQFIPESEKLTNPLYQYARQGDVSVGTASFGQQGPIYGDVTTNGGSLTTANSNITGTIDNTVQFTMPPQYAPSGPWTLPAGRNLTPATGGSAASPTKYYYNSLTGGAPMILNPAAGGGDTYVTVYINGDITAPITVKPNVHARIYFSGNINLKATQIINDNLKAAYMQFYGVSPAAGVTKTVEINPPGNMYAVIYAPGHDIIVNGNPDIFGSIAGKSFYGNGNVGFHYDLALKDIGIASDYKIASYVEDIR